MTTRGLITIVVTMAFFATIGYGEDITPGDLLKKVEARYQSMQTYKAEGTINSNIDTGEHKINTATTFSILLKKPNMYLITWNQNMPMPGMVQSGAVWSDGTQPYLYMGIMKAYAKMTSDEVALGAATGISGGAAFTIPSFFLSVFEKKIVPFSQLHDPKIEKMEKVDGDDCYVLSSPSTISKKETFWISKDRSVIRKYERSLESPAGKKPIPEMTDAQIKQAVKGMGQKVTEENMKKMREMLEKARTLQKTKLKGFSIEYHKTISSPECTKADFKFTLPAGVVLKDSLFGNIFSGNKSVPSKNTDPDK